MRIEGTFLHSTVARRVFWTLLATAVLPLLVFGALGYRSLVAQLQTQADGQAAALVKHVGLRTFDRLSAARAALAAHAEAADWALPRPQQPELRVLLGPVSTVADLVGSADGSHGDADLAGAWAAAGGTAAPGRTLWWQPAAGGAPARVIVGHRDGAGRGWWLAEVQPGFVWADLLPDGPGAALCVTDLQQRPLYCGEHAAPDAGVDWALFLDGAFGSPDWRFAGPGAASVFGDTPLTSWVLQGLLATGLLIVTLGLVLVRRLMVPLERLVEGTRRLAAGALETRVQLPATDEFGELATSLNVMAERVGQQMQSLAVHAAIDRAILHGGDIDDIMMRVAARMQALRPAARVRVVARRASAGRWLVYRPDAAPPVPAQGPAAPGPAAFALSAACAAPNDRPTPEWMRAALGPDAPEHASAVPALWRGELLAVLLVADTAPLDDAVRHELAQLSDSVAVSLAAAEREHKLVERAVHDGLTGLLNRDGLREACAALLASTGVCTLVFIDLDGFKAVNDAFGHLVGDELLHAVAGRLRTLAPPGALLARPGGDEFVVVLAAPAGEAEALAQRACKRLAEPFALGEHQAHIGASIGIASSPEDGSDQAELMRRADLAMYAAKAAGRGVWRRYAPALDEHVAERAWIVRDLREALGGRGLAVHYQARIDRRSGAVRSAEALLRWQHPTRGAIGPDRFIPVAEDSGLIVPLGRFVLGEALRQQRLWRDAGLPVQRVAVNVSARQLQDDAFAPEVLRAVARHGLQPQDLELEITESLLVGDVDAVCARLAPLREAGVAIALDDFGTGYSSLAALHRLPVDVLKIDRAFVVDLGRRESADAVARTVVALARALGKRVVAEGVETPLQQAQLAALGCDEFQGYLFARPMPPEAFAERVRQGFAEASTEAA